MLWSACVMFANVTEKLLGESFWAENRLSLRWSTLSFPCVLNMTDCSISEVPIVILISVNVDAIVYVTVRSCPRTPIIFPEPSFRHDAADGHFTVTVTSGVGDDVIMTTWYVMMRKYRSMFLWVLLSFVRLLSKRERFIGLSFNASVGWYEYFISRKNIFILKRSDGIHVFNLILIHSFSINRFIDQTRKDVWCSIKY